MDLYQNFNLLDLLICSVITINAAYLFIYNLMRSMKASARGLRLTFMISYTFSLASDLVSLSFFFFVPFFSGQLYLNGPQFLSREKYCLLCYLYGCQQVQLMIPPHHTLLHSSTFSFCSLDLGSSLAPPGELQCSSQLELTYFQLCGKSQRVGGSIQQQ